MSRFAPVVPIHMAEDLQRVGLFGDYHLPLAHDVLKFPDEYTSLFRTVRESPESFVILDNSLIELGASMDLHSLVQAAEAVSPDCVVIPDELGSGKNTMRMAAHFIEEWNAYTKDFASDNRPDLMGVVQGASIDECMEVVDLYRMAGVQYISVPRVCTKILGSRIPLLVEILRLNEAFAGIHLLGFSDNVFDDLAAAKLPGVMGIDSAVPIRAGLRRMYLDLNNPNWSTEVGGRGDFWEQPCGSYWHSARPYYRANMEIIRRLIK